MFRGMIKIKKVFKYGTGDQVPEGAVYLCTKIQKKVKVGYPPKWVNCWLVWHYFLVELKVK